MPAALTRRTLLVSSAATALAGLGCAGLSTPVGATTLPLAQTLESVERRSGGRLGVVIQDTASGQTWRHRAEERFPLTSTFKAFAVAAVLAEVHARRRRLDEIIRYTAADLVPYSPVTSQHVATGMSLSALCAAALAVSDNTAGNLLLMQIGGPVGLTAFMRGIGDSDTRLDRWETALNEASPGDPRDTTTPQAAAASLSRLLLGDTLLPHARDLLTGWMINDQVAGPLLRAGFPAGWVTADRTGAGGHGSRAIIAVSWPTGPGGRKPIVAAIYLTQTKLTMDERNAAFAEIGRAIAAAVI